MSFVRTIVVAAAVFGAYILSAATDNASRSAHVTTSVSAALQQKLLAVREEVWQDWYKNDQDGLKKLVPEELIAIDPGEAEWKNRTQFLASARDFADHHGRLVSLKFPKTEIQMFGDTAVLFSLYEVRFEYDGKEQMLSGRATEVFHLDRGQWLNTGWHVDSGK